MTATGMECDNLLTWETVTQKRDNNVHVQSLRHTHTRPRILSCQWNDLKFTTLLLSNELIGAWGSLTLVFQAAESCSGCYRLALQRGAGQILPDAEVPQAYRTFAVCVRQVRLDRCALHFSTIATGLKCGAFGHSTSERIVKDEKPVYMCSAGGVDPTASTLGSQAGTCG